VGELFVVIFFKPVVINRVSFEVDPDGDEKLTPNQDKGVPSGPGFRHSLPATLAFLLLLAYRAGELRQWLNP